MCNECNVRRCHVKKDRLRNAKRKRKAFLGTQSGRFQQIDVSVCEFVTEKSNEGMNHNQSYHPDVSVFDPFTVPLFVRNNELLSTPSVFPDRTPHTLEYALQIFVIAFIGTF